MTNYYFIARTIFMQQVDKNRNSNNEKIIIEVEANFKCTRLSVFVKRNCITSIILYFYTELLQFNI